MTHIGERGGDLVVDGENKIETYYDHYKETCELSRAAQSRRNTGFVTLCVLEAVSFLFTINPDLICGFLNEAVNKELETTIQLSNDYLQSFVWILTAYVLVRYVQNTLYIERLYPYIAMLERKIANELGEDPERSIITREGKHYSERYPLVLNIVDVFYKKFAPILFTVINIIHIFKELRAGGLILALICDITVCLAILTITASYFFTINSKTKS